MRKLLRLAIRLVATAVNKILSATMVLTHRLVPNRVLFLSDVRAELGGNLECLWQRLPARFEKVVSLKPNRATRRSLADKAALAKLLATSQYVLLDDFSISVNEMIRRDGQQVVQLWHGAGAFKTFGYSRCDQARRSWFSPRGHRNYTTAIVSSEQVRWCFAEGFGMPIDNVVATGIPRCDVFFDDTYKQRVRRQFFADNPQLAGKKLILFAPTYRGTSLAGAYYDFDQLDLPAIYEALHEDHVFLFKWHHGIHDNLRTGRLSFEIPEQYRDFYFDFSDNRDINDLLIVADVLVTDYSSVIFDYCLLGKPVVYFAYDLAGYAGDRGLYYPFSDYLYGPTATTSAGLITAINHSRTDDDPRRQSFVARFMQACQGDSTEQVYQLVFGDHPADSPSDRCQAGGVLAASQMA